MPLIAETGDLNCIVTDSTTLPEQLNVVDHVVAIGKAKDNYVAQAYPQA